MTPPPAAEIEPTGITFDDQICFALYSASRSVTARYRPMLDPLGLTYPQYLVLLLLWENGSTSVRQLGTRLHLDSGTLSPLLKRLETSGVISRHRSTADERSVDIRLTPKGRRLKAKTAGIPTEICRATGLDLERLSGLVAELRALTSSVRKDLVG